MDQIDALHDQSFRTNVEATECARNCVWLRCDGTRESEREREQTRCYCETRAKRKRGKSPTRRTISMSGRVCVYDCAGYIFVCLMLFFHLFVVVVVASCGWSC